MGGPGRQEGLLCVERLTFTPIPDDLEKPHRGGPKGVGPVLG